MANFQCLLFISSLVSICHLLTIKQKASILQPIQYELSFLFRANVSASEFNYSLSNELHFDLPRQLDVIVLETLVSHCHVINVTFGDDHDQVLHTKVERFGHLFVLFQKNGSMFQPGHYMVLAFLRNEITPYKQAGIQYTMHMDQLTKDWYVNCEIVNKVQQIKFCFPGATRFFLTFCPAIACT